ncbi:MAG: LysR family transcriptional regulator [Pseudomonas sp.]
MSHLRGIETFVKTVECGSIAAAARQLGITAAAASQNVARLEKELGTRLLTRTTRSQALTAAGEVYFARVGPILGELAQARSEISDLHHEVRGRLKIASWVAIGRHVIAPLLPAFIARYPKVQVEVMITDKNVDHLKDSVDVGIRSHHGLEAGLVARRIATVPMILCAAPTYLDLHGRPTEPENLNAHACLAFRMPNDGRLMEWPFLRAGERLAPKRNVVAASNDNDTLVAMAVAGGGIARLGSFVVNPLISQGLLEPLFLRQSGTGNTQSQADPEPMEFFVVYRDRHHIPAPVRAFVDFIVDALENHELLKEPAWPRMI